MMDDTTIAYATESAPIGPNLWRCVVAPAVHDPGCYLVWWQWRPAADEPWKPVTDWPQYDPRDRFRGGPRELARLYAQNLPAIRAALARGRKRREDYRLATSRFVSMALSSPKRYAAEPTPQDDTLGLPLFDAYHQPGLL